METEIWKDIKGYEGLYQVSNFGNVMTLNYKHTGKMGLMKPYKNKQGYLLVKLYKDEKRKNYKVHRLVAESFLPNPNNFPCVNHKDEDKENNFVGTPEKDYKDGNLEWCTHEYNNNYGSHNERVAKANTNGKKSKKVLQLSLDGDLIREWPSVAECSRNGYDFRNVSACCRGERKSAYGFIWRYK